MSDVNVFVSDNSRKSGNHLWSVEMVDSVMKREPVIFKKWRYDVGLVLKGVGEIWERTQDKKYFDYIEAYVDMFIDEEGNISGYHMEDYNIDHVNNGKLLLFVYSHTGEEKYKKAADLLREQLGKQPRTGEGGFWHKKIYTSQMWLDGLYMGSPFYAEYTKLFGDAADFDDIAKQFILMNKYSRDSKTGLLYHAWDESKVQKWADPETGCSPHFWGRAMGWYAMAVVDMLDYMPENHKNRSEIIEIFKNMIDSLVKVQDKASGVWYQVPDLGDRIGNYLEASSSCMYVYAMAKALRNGYLGSEYKDIVKKAYKGVIDTFVSVDEIGMVNLRYVCMVAGLGNVPYRDGSYQYYISEPIKLNDPKGVGAFILASYEMEKMA